MKNLLFENVECTRCGGSGEMPFTVEGGRCFKCHGDGATLTKRGKVAQDYLESLRHRPANEIKVGDFVKFRSMFSTSFKAVLKIEKTKNGLRLELEGAAWELGEFDSIRVPFTKEEKKDHRALALQYQEKLTKAGKPRKRGMK